jgi:hypothetical protein
VVAQSAADARVYIFDQHREQKGNFKGALEANRRL